MTKRDIHNGLDIIDSRDIIERLADLKDIEKPSDEEQAEFTALSALADEASGSPD